MKTVPEIMAAMTAVVDLAESETRSLNDDEVERYEQLEKELQSVSKTAEITKRQEIYKAPQGIGFPSVIKASPKGDEALEFAFINYLRTGQKNTDLDQLYAQTEGTSSAGGYLVPTTMLNRLIERRKAFGGFMNAARQLTTAQGNPIEIPTVDDTANTAEIVAEMASPASAGADIVFGTKTLGAYKYVASGASNAPLRVSVELLQDSAVDIESMVAQVLSKRLNRKMAYDVVRGSGSGEPEGIAYGTAGTTEVDLVGVAQLLTTVHALDPEYRQNAKWAFNDATAALIEGFVDGNGRPLLINAVNGIADSLSRPTLLGYPVVIDQAFPDANADNVIYAAFGDFEEAYIVRHVRDIQLWANPYANPGYVEFEAWARMDGKIVDPNAYVTLEGV